VSHFNPTANPAGQLDVGRDVLRYRLGSWLAYGSRSPTQSARSARPGAGKKT
jgi:hypothetical protein